MWSDLDKSLRSTSVFFNDSRDSSDRVEASARSKNVVPVMIQHILQYGVNLKFGESPVYIVTFLGIVRHIEQASAKITYTIEDQTGSITGIHWLETEQTPKCKINLNTYARVYAHIKEENKKPFALILRISPMAKLNDLTSHLLEVTHMVLKTKPKARGSHNKSLNETKDVPMSTDNTLFSGLTTEQTIVFKIIQKENDSGNGIDRNTLKSHAPRNILSDVDDILEFLISEGHIYTTLTDDHFKTT